MAQLMQLEDLELNLVRKKFRKMNKIHNSQLITNINGFFFTGKQCINRQAFT
jgi:hypothetical protein